MSRLPSFLLGMATGAMLLYGAMHFHVLRTRNGFHFVPKVPPHMSEAYLDVRQYSVSDWANHPQLAAALVRANKQYVMQDAATGAFQDGVNQMLPAWPQQ